jgi:hypothetical protein
MAPFLVVVMLITIPGFGVVSFLDFPRGRYQAGLLRMLQRLHPACAAHPDIVIDPSLGRLSKPCF